MLKAFAMSQYDLIILKPQLNLPDYYPWHSLHLKSGVYSVKAVESVVETQTAYNPFDGNVSPTGTNGELRKGWLNTFWMSILRLSTDPGHESHMFGTGRWETEKDAVANAKPHKFDLVSPSIVTFYIHGDFTNDVGGLTLELAQT